MLVQDLDVEADGFLAGEGVEVAADSVHFAGDALGGARFGALEDHVLDKVGDAVDLGQLVARASANPNAHGDGADVIHFFSQNREPVGQDSAAYVAFIIHL